MLNNKGPVVFPCPVDYLELGLTTVRQLHGVYTGSFLFSRLQLFFVIIPWGGHGRAMRTSGSRQKVFPVLSPSPKTEFGTLVGSKTKSVFTSLAVTIFIKDSGP